MPLAHGLVGISLPIGGIASYLSHLVNSGELFPSISPTAVSTARSYAPGSFRPLGPTALGGPGEPGEPGCTPGQ